MVKRVFSWLVMASCEHSISTSTIEFKLCLTWHHIQILCFLFILYFNITFPLLLVGIIWYYNIQNGYFERYFALNNNIITRKNLVVWLICILTSHFPFHCWGLFDIITYKMGFLKAILLWTLTRKNFVF